MDQLLTPGQRRPLWPALAWMIFGGTALTGFAGNLPDPTLPPSQMQMAQTGPTASTELPVLQSVLTSPTRKLAIINGQEIALGEKFGHARLIQVGDDSVVLLDGKNRQTLKLFPEVQKKIKPGSSSGKNNGAIAGPNNPSVGRVEQ